MDYTSKSQPNDVLSLSQEQFLRIIKSAVAVARRTVYFSDVIKAPEIEPLHRKFLVESPVDFLAFLQPESHYLLDSALESVGQKPSPEIRAKIYGQINIQSIDDGIRTLALALEQNGAKLQADAKIRLRTNSKIVLANDFLYRLVLVRRAILVIKLLAIESIVKEYGVFFEHFRKNPATPTELAIYMEKINNVLQKIYDPNTDRDSIPDLVKNVLADINMWPRSIRPSNILLSIDALKSTLVAIKYLVGTQNTGRVDVQSAINRLASDIVTHD